MSEMITSTKNEYIKLVRSLTQKKRRDETGLFMAEGDRTASEALAYADVSALVCCDESCVAASLAREKGVRTVLVSRQVMEAVSDAKTPQSAIAVVRRRDAAVPPDGRLYVALEDVADPGNVGAVIRPADAAGAAAVLISAGSADYTSPKAVRSAMGSIFHIPVVVTADLAGALGELKKNGVGLAAAQLTGSENAMLPKRCCIMIGNEARGLSAGASALADTLVRIPIYGRAESLNAAVAAGILIYRAAWRP